MDLFQRFVRVESTFNSGVDRIVDGCIDILHLQFFTDRFLDLFVDKFVGFFLDVFSGS